MINPKNKISNANVLRQKAEEILKNRSSKGSNFSAENDLRKLLHELQVYQIELEMQNEELALAKEREVTAAEDKYKKLYDFAPSGFITLNEKGEIVELNHSGTTLLGKTRQNLIGCDFSLFISKDSKLKFSQFLARAFKSGVNHQSYELILTINPKDTLKHVLMKGRILENAEQCQILLIDISSKKEAEDKLRQSYLFNDTLLKTIPFGMQIVDETGTVLFQNENFKEIFGKGAIGKKCWKLLRDDKNQCSYCPLLKGITIGETRSTEFIGILGGRMFEISHTGMNFDGKKAMLEVFQDITDRKSREQQLKQALEKAKESDRLKSAFLANMSHEIRTPMNGILGFADLLKEPNLTGQEQKKYIGIIEKSGLRMINTINDIIDISKIESGQMTISLSNISINECLEECYKFFKPEAAKKNIEFRLINGLQSKDVIIRSDHNKLLSIFNNLIKNAIKFTTKGSIELGCNLNDSKSELIFYIKDTGIGIPIDRQNAIFERFIQSNIDGNMAQQGSGLGLAISKVFIEMLEGKIWLESKVNVGSTFYVKLPYKKGNLTEKVSPTLNEEKHSKKLKLLIVEDDEISHQLIFANIKHLTKEIIYAKNGKEAIEACRNIPDIDLVLMDIKMPKMNGYEATKQIREFNKEVIIIAQTAFALTGDKDKAIGAGCNDYITKPIKKEEVEFKIRKHFL